MEYKKSVKEVQNAEEYKKIPKEYHEPGKEYFLSTEEYHPVVKEYLTDGETIEEQVTQTIEKSSRKAKKKKRISVTKKIRKMGYLVAASVAVVSVSNTVEPMISGNKYEESVDDNLSSENDSETENDIIDNGSGNEVPGDEQSGSGTTDDGTLGNDTQGDASENLESEYFVISKYDNYSTVNEGVFLVKEDGLWGLMNISGEWISEPKYNGNNWCAPNDDGYSVVNNDNVYYILDKNGKEIFTWDLPAKQVMITDNNIIYVEQSSEQTYDGKARASYWKVNGTLIYEAVDLTGDIFETTAFNDGIAMINMSTDINHSSSPHMLLEDGTIQKVNNSYFWVYQGPHTDGYFLGYSPEGRALIDVRTGNSTSAFWGSEVIAKYAPSFVTGNVEFKGYYEDGQYLFNYGTYGCLEAANGEEKINILFDFRDANWDTYNLDRIIAIYDEIIMDDAQYLCAMNDGEYFYIDWNGNVVSDTYMDAVAFNEDGYAMIVETSGNAYLINEHFEKLDVIENVKGIGTFGDAIGITLSNDDIVIYFPEQEINRE